MAFIIESSATIPFIHTRMIDPVRKNDASIIQSQLREMIAKRRKHSCIYLGINLTAVLMQEEVPLVHIISQLAEIYHETRNCYQLELLIVVEPSLITVVRYIAESLGLPMLFFATYETLHTYVRRRTEDTQPISAEMARAAVATLVVEDY